MRQNIFSPLNETDQTPSLEAGFTKWNNECRASKTIRYLAMNDSSIYEQNSTESLRKDSLGRSSEINYRSASLLMLTVMY